ncbi:MAG: hypothetical protein SGPRY_014470 [Prymnesium sp.]
MRMPPFKRRWGSTSWEKLCHHNHPECWRERPQTTGVMMRVMGDVDRCAHLRFRTLEEAQAGCVARGAQCEAISRDAGLPCDFLLNLAHKQTADHTAACLQGQWPVSDGFPDFSLPSAGGSRYIEGGDNKRTVMGEGHTPIRPPRHLLGTVGTAKWRVLGERGAQ